MFYARWALQALALGRVVRSVYSTGGGRTIYFLEKRPVAAIMHETLAKLGIDAASTPSLDNYAASVSNEARPPARAPGISTDHEWDQSQVRQILRLLRLDQSARAEDEGSMPSAAVVGEPPLPNVAAFDGAADVGGLQGDGERLEEEGSGGHALAEAEATPDGAGRVGGLAEEAEPPSESVMGGFGA